MIHVSVAVEEVTLKRRSRLFLCVAGLLRFVLVVPITAIPGTRQTKFSVKFYCSIVQGFKGSRVRLFKGSWLGWAMQNLPWWAMWFPGTKTHPAKVCLAILIFTNHVIAASVLFYSDITFWTFFCVGRDPVRRLTVVITLLPPFAQ